MDSTRWRLIRPLATDLPVGGRWQMQLSAGVMVACLAILPIAGCSKPSLPKLARQAIRSKDTSALRALVGQHPEVVSFELAALAVAYENVPAVRELIKAQPTLLFQGSGFDGATLLHSALLGIPSADLVQCLLDCGAPPNQPDRTGRYPLHILCTANGDEKCLKLLLSRGADPTVRWEGKTTAELARQSGYESAAEILQAALIARAGEADQAGDESGQ